MPKILTIKTTDGSIHQVLSWMFLHTGAFHDGDIVEVFGEIAIASKQTIVMLNRKEHYIKLANGTHMP